MASGVYFARFGDRIKVGHSAYVARRLNELRPIYGPGELLGVIPNRDRVQLVTPQFISERQRRLDERSNEIGVDRKKRDYSDLGKPAWTKALKC